ncbi:MAG: hypothetical protein JW876_02675 [Candidatus Krumholzibacteriota bacterium]|nr:hypothetical protein [Candidatus Krumholzibacteriota bacterium]
MTGRTIVVRSVSRELAWGGMFGAAALLLPMVFHVLHLGSVFMPMYLPLVALAFFARPSTAAATAFVVPLLSGALTGMPPFYPPVAPAMSIELAAMAAAISWLRLRLPGAGEYALLVPVLLAGRILNVGLVYLAASVVSLPERFMAGLSLASGWPGLLLIVLVVPPLVRASGRHCRRETGEEGTG